MHDLSLVIAPDPLLKRIAEPVDRVDTAIRQLMDDMLALMYRSNGIGLAAPQVGVLKRIIVLDVSGPEGPPQPMRIINPHVLTTSEARVSGEEGCLSLPDQFAEVTRPAGIRLRYRDENDAIQERDADGLLAKCLQHEIDHLDGVLFIDHLSSLKRGIILRRLTKAKRLAAV